MPKTHFGKTYSVCANSINKRVKKHCNNAKHVEKKGKTVTCTLHGIESTNNWNEKFKSQKYGIRSSFWGWLKILITNTGPHKVQNKWILISIINPINVGDKNL